MRTKKSWRQKLADSKDLPRVVTCDAKGKFGPRWGLKAGDTLVIPAPKDVDALMKRVRKGKVTTINAIRAALARRHGTRAACPITTGIFASVAAHAADEARREGRKRITPYWRTLKTGGQLNPKYPGGLDAQRKLLESEGHRVLRKGKKLVVADYEHSLMTLPD